jgi:hypothetical protein
MPREIVLELNTRRATRPIFWSGETIGISRPELTLELAKRLFDEVSQFDGIRLTLAGVGDPLLASNVVEILDAVVEVGLHVHLETDLVNLSPEAVARLAVSTVDVISVHLPALSRQTYEGVMGRDGYAQVLENIRRFVSERQARGSGVPILVPVFTKCRKNFGEMEAWYDRWIQAAGSAVIRGPSTYGGRIAETSVADMAPPGRRSCQRLSSRVTILCDGRIVSCEQDALGEQTLGRLGEDSVARVWQEKFSRLRADHLRSQFERLPLCAGCGDWHRP